MADPAVSVSPYWELTFDADGTWTAGKGTGCSPRCPGAEAARSDPSSRTAGTTTAPARPASTASSSRPCRISRRTRVWATSVWCGPRCGSRTKPISSTFPGRRPLVPADARTALDKDTRHALLEVFPDRATVVEQLAPAGPTTGRGSLVGGVRAPVRLLVEVSPQGPQAAFAADTLAEGAPQGDPAMLFGDTATVCGEFAEVLAGMTASGEAFALPRPWDGARELLRQATYYAMKRRAGTVGERGLGRALGSL